jgi:hypothetical protein
MYKLCHVIHVLVGFLLRDGFIWMFIKVLCGGVCGYKHPYYVIFNFSHVFFEHWCVGRDFIKGYVMFIKESRGGVCRKEFLDPYICLLHFYINMFALCPYIACSHMFHSSVFTVCHNSAICATLACTTLPDKLAVVAAAAAVGHLTDP